MKGCPYAVHPRCTMRVDVCDGKELEGEPEEAYENIKMFEEKGDGIIQHSSHPHHQMRLDKGYDENKHADFLYVMRVTCIGVYNVISISMNHAHIFLVLSNLCYISIH